MRSRPMILFALLLTFGSLSDRFGSKGMLLAGLAVVGAASLAGGFTTSPAQLIAARERHAYGPADDGTGRDRTPMGQLRIP